MLLQNYPDMVPVPFDELQNGAERSDIWRVLVLHKVS
jgi:mannosyltransferase OCH1-like enzyme